MKEEHYTERIIVFELSFNAEHAESIIILILFGFIFITINYVYIKVKWDHNDEICACNERWSSL